MVTISISSDLQRLASTLDAMGQRQMAFATAKALTATAIACKSAVTAAMPEEFDRPTPVTQRAIGTTSATKATLTATVFVKDVQAGYLRVQATGGPQVRHGKALLEPKSVKLNQYGNLPRNKLKALLGQPDVFAGRIKFRNGKTVSGVWRRPPVGQRGDKSGAGTKGNTKRMVGGQRTGLQLLVRFADGVVLPPRFPFADQVTRTAASKFKGELSASLEQALKTAK